MYTYNYMYIHVQSYKYTYVCMYINVYVVLLCALTQYGSVQHAWQELASLADKGELMAVWNPANLISNFPMDVHMAVGVKW